MDSWSVDDAYEKWSSAAYDIAQPWIWRTGAFAGEFGDAYIDNTNLEGGDVSSSIEILLNICRPITEEPSFIQQYMTLFSPETDIPALRSVINDFYSAVTWGRELHAVRNNPRAFIEFLTHWIASVKALQIGHRIIINGGWLIAGEHKSKIAKASFVS
jgi:hypothetical protein